MSDQMRFDQWAVLELFGHQRIAGRVTEQAVGGCAFVRVDVPKIGDDEAFTKLFGNGAIYAFTIVTEEVARAVAASIRAQPINPFDIPLLRQKPLPLRSDQDYDGDDLRHALE